MRLILTFLALGALAFVTANLYNTSIQIELRSYAAPSAANGEGATTTASAWEGPQAPKGDPEEVVAAVDALVGGAGSEEASEEEATFHTWRNSMPCRSDTRLVRGELPCASSRQKWGL